MADSSMDLKIRISAEDRANAILKAAAEAIKQVDQAQLAAAKSARDWQTLGARSGKDIAAEMNRVKEALAGIRSSGASFGEISRASEAARGRLAQLQGELRGVGQGAISLGGAFKTAFTGLVGLMGGLALGNIIQAAEQFSTLRVKLEQSEGSTQAAGVALERLGQIAKSTGTPVVELGQSYERFSRAISAMGGSQEQALNFTEALAGALKLSGATAQEAGAVMTQLSQAFQSGTLSGDEFKSVAENGGRVLEFLAKQLGVSRGELKEMSKAGELTSKELLKLGEASKQIAAEAANMPTTLNAAWANFNTTLTETLSNSEAFRAVMSTLSAVILAVADNVGVILAALGGMAIAWAAAGVAANTSIAGILFGLGSMAGSVIAATASVAALKTALIGLLATPWGLFLGALAAVVGYVGMQWVSSWGAADKAQATALDNLKAKLKEAETNLNNLDAKIGQSKDRLTALFADIGKQYDAAAKLGSESVEGELSIIRERYDRERELLRTLVSDKDQLRAQETQLTIKQAQEEYAVIKQSSDQRLKLIAEEYNQKMRFAQAGTNTAEGRAKLEEQAQRQLLERLKQLWTEEAAAYGQHLKDLEGQANASAKRIEEINQERADGIKSINDAIKAAEMDNLHDAARAEEERKQNVQEVAQLKAKVAEGDQQALLKLIALYQQQYELEKKAAGNENLQLNANERTREQVELINNLKAAQDLYLQGKEAQAQIERENNAALNAQLETMNELVGKAKDNIQSVKEIFAEGALLTIGVKEQEFKDEVVKLEQWVNERKGAKLTISALEGDVAKLEGDAAKLADGLKPTELKARFDLREGADNLGKDLSALVEQTNVPELPVGVKVEDPAQAVKAVGDEVKAESEQQDLAVSVGANLDKAQAELQNVDSLVAEKAVWIEVEANTRTAVSQIEGIQSQLSNLRTQSTHTITTNASQALAEIMSLNGRNTSSTHTIYVRKVERNALGGLVGLAAGGFPRRRGYITGPGTETSDSIPAMLSRGEFVIRAAAVRQWGIGFLQALNRGFMPSLPRLAAGGMPMPAVASQAGLPEMAINLSVQGGSPLRVLSSRETAKNLANALRNLERGR